MSAAISFEIGVDHAWAELRALRRVALRITCAVILAGVAAAGIIVPAQAAGKDTLVVASGAEAVTLDPHVSLEGQSPLLWRAVYESLLTYKGDTLELVPNLAESYEVSPDGLTYTFRIRPGIKFTDGEPLNAAAVKLNIERQIAVKQGISYALAPVTEIQTPDDLTVVLKLSSPSDGFLSAFAGACAPYIISPKAIREHEVDGDWAQGWLRSDMVGTGPYMLQSYSQSQQAVFKRNPTYWRGWDGNHFETVVVKYLQEPLTERLLLEQGEIDVALYLPADMVEELDGKPGITVTDVPSFNVYYIALPTTKGPTADKRVRQAISYGFNYESWVKNFLHGKGKQARGPLPSNFVGFNSDAPQYSYDPEKAKALLAEAGYPNGGFTLKYTYETGYWWKRPLGELFQANMRDLGIDVEIQELSASTWNGLLSNPDTAEHAYGLVWWPTLRTPSDFLFPVFATGAQGSAGFNWNYYSNPEVDRLLDQAAVEPDESKRNALYAQIQTILVEDAPMLFLHEQSYRLPMRDDLKGHVFNGFYIEMLDFYALHKE